METFDIIIWCLAGLAVIGLIFLFVFNVFIIPKRRTKDILGELTKILEVKKIKYEIRVVKFKWYNFEIELENDILLFKHFFMTPKQELFVESKYRWQIEGGSNSYLYVKHVEPFLRGKYENKTDKKVRRVALLYPGCKNTMIYTKGIQTEFITPKIDVFGCRIISFEELSECFDWLIDDSNTHVRH